MAPDPKLRTTLIQALTVTAPAGSLKAVPTGRRTLASPRITDTASAGTEPSAEGDLSAGSGPAPDNGPSSGKEPLSGKEPPSGAGPSRRGLSLLPDSGHLVGGLYKLVRLLGKGMFGKVYVAQRVDVPEHQVALKLLPRALYATRNVERELVMLATVGHPNVVQLKDHGMTSDYVWLTMPVYEGETLAERLERGTIGLREAYDIFVPIARGLEALHAAGLRHQDVKPENIYLARFGGRVHPILLDLGVAAEREATFCAGTALFAAPEQIRALNAYPGAVPLSEKMDTYGLASTLLMALVGPDDFPGDKAESRAELAEAHEVRAISPLGPSVLPELTGRPRELLLDALKMWLAIEQSDRPSMAEVAEQLDVLLEPEREAAREEKRLRARQKTALLRLRIAGGAVLLAAVAGALVAFSKRETWQIAQELERARREGAESFDKLDTCIASYRISEGGAIACRTAREQDRTEYRQALLAIEKSGTTSQTEHARELQSMQALHAGRIKALEEEAAAAAKASVEERERLRKAWEQERAALASERDELKALTEKRAAEIVALTEQRNVCDAERATCIADRDRCQAAAADIFMDLGRDSASAGPSVDVGRDSASTAPSASRTTPPASPPPPPTGTSSEPPAPSSPPGPPASSGKQAPPAPPPPPPPDPGNEEEPYDP